MHFTPTHASWLNQIDLWFSIYARKKIKSGVFNSKDDLVAKTLEFIKLHNKNAKPFRCTYTGDPLTIIVCLIIITDSSEQLCCRF